MMQLAKQSNPHDPVRAWAISIPAPRSRLNCARHGQERARVKRIGTFIAGPSTIPLLRPEPRAYCTGRTSVLEL